MASRSVLQGTLQGRHYRRFMCTANILRCELQGIVSAFREQVRCALYFSSYIDSPCNF